MGQVLLGVPTLVLMPLVIGKMSLCQMSPNPLLILKTTYQDSLKVTQMSVRKTLISCLLLPSKYSFSKMDVYYFTIFEREREKWRIILKQTLGWLDGWQIDTL